MASKGNRRLAKNKKGLIRGAVEQRRLRQSGESSWNPFKKRSRKSKRPA